MECFRRKKKETYSIFFFTPCLIYEVYPLFCVVDMLTCWSIVAVVLATYIRRPLLTNHDFMYFCPAHHAAFMFECGWSAAGYAKKCKYISANTS